MKYLLLVMVIFMGCSVSQNGQIIFEGTCNQFSESGHLTWDVNTQMGDSLLITLCSNPTTGFQWQDSADISDENILKQINHRFIPDGGNMLGASGKEEWILSSLKKGTSIVVWKYSRPWDGGEKKEWSLTATVIVD